MTTASNIIRDVELDAIAPVEPEIVSLDEMLERGAAYGLELDALVDPNHTLVDRITYGMSRYRDPFELCVLLEQEVGAPIATTQY